MLPAAIAEQFLDTALSALRSGGDWRASLDALPVPVYTTDCDGSVTYWNRACVEFAGREPELGQDRWCVTWQLYTLSGEPLPHDECPMAEAIRTRSKVRGKIAIALRPDGSRRAFRPYPTPLHDENEAFTGAVNMLIDVSAEQAEALAEQAARCRRLSRATTDPQASRILADMAAAYAETAAALQPAR
ncbi:MAG TPA: PAS domain-containing protein [Sphingomicrobium sp.]|nr:PAS domain-containing protein [Sphingomicrobium sp.]